MSSEQSGPDIRDFELPAAGYAVLVTWPEVRDGKHAQEVWYVHLGCFVGSEAARFTSA